MRKARMAVVTANTVLGIAALALFLASSVEAASLVGMNPGVTWGNDLYVCVRPDDWSSAPMTYARARVGGQEYDLSYGQCYVVMPDDPMYMGYRAKIDISGFSKGAYAVDISLIDINGAQYYGSYMVNKDAPPKVALSSPQKSEISANKEFLLEASCLDDGNTCQMVVNWGGRDLYRADAYLKTMVSCEGKNSSQILKISISDEIQSSTQEIKVNCVDNAQFSLAATTPGVILGYSQGKAIMLEKANGGTYLRYYDLVLGKVEKELCLESLGGSPSSLSNYVIAGDGVAFVRSAEGRYQVEYWDGVDVFALGDATTNRIRLAGYELGVVRVSAYAGQSGMDQLVLYDPKTRKSRFEIEGPQINAVAKKDGLAYSIEEKLFTYRNGLNRQLEIGCPTCLLHDWATDGNLVAYTAYDAFYVNDGSGETLLVPGQLKYDLSHHLSGGKAYDVADGRVVYWKRNDGGVGGLGSATADLWMWDKAKGPRMIVPGLLISSLVGLQKDGWVFFKANTGEFLALKEGEPYRIIPSYPGSDVKAYYSDYYIYDGKETYLRILDAIFRFAPAQSTYIAPNLLMKMMPSIIKAIPSAVTNRSRER